MRSNTPERSEILSITADILADTAWRVVTVWGNKPTIQRMPTPQQAYLTAAVCQCLKKLGKSRFESHRGLTPAILQGISNRLDSPTEWVRRQAMRVGKILSLTLDPSAVPLFGTDDLDLLPEERWEETKHGNTNGSANTTNAKKKKFTSSKGKEKQENASIKRRVKGSGATRSDNDIDNGYPLTETDSDDSDDDSSIGSISSSDSEFERYDLEESDEESPDRTTLQLRDLITMLHKGDSDWKGHLKALRSAETLIRAAPDELVHYSVPLARALLFARIPEWADEETPANEDAIEDQRFRSLVALTVAAPEGVGLQLAIDVYSPSMDIQQRSRALAVLGTAAEELSSPGSILKPLPGLSNNNNNNNSLEQPAYNNSQQQRTNTRDGKAGRVVRASERSLAAQQKKVGPLRKNEPHANRFPPIALKWAAALLKECDVRRHGVDLFGRDYFILGRLVATLGSLLEASQRSSEAVFLSTAVLELIKGHQVHDSDEPYVRKAALMAASHVLMAVPPASIATALLPQRGTAATMQPSPLMERLEWLKEWVDETAQNDPDNNCRMMAAACKGLQGALSAEAMASLADGHLLGDSGGMTSKAALGGSGPKLNVILPSIENLSLGTKTRLDY